MFLAFQNAKQVANELADSPRSKTNWLLCVADRHATEMAALLDACREKGLVVCGGIFPGLIHGGEGLEHGIIAFPLPSGSRIALASLGEGGIRWEKPLPENARGDFSSSIIIVDCLAPNIDLLLDDMYDRYSNRMHHMGAGAGYHDLQPSPTVFTAEGIHEKAGLVVILPARMTSNVRHGWERVAGPFIVSRSKGNRIQELNWEPAGRFYRTQVGLQNPVYRDKPVFPDLSSAYPLCIAKEGSEDIIRDPFQITEFDEVVTFSDVAENSVVYLAHGDQDSLIRAATRAVRECYVPAEVEFCFISDCYSRATMLGGDFSRELESARKTLAEVSDVEPEGVQALGEIAANGTGKLEYFNKTFVIGLVHASQ